MGLKSYRDPCHTSTNNEPSHQLCSSGEAPALKKIQLHTNSQLRFRFKTTCIQLRLNLPSTLLQDLRLVKMEHFKNAKAAFTLANFSFVGVTPGIHTTLVYSTCENGLVVGSHQRWSTMSLTLVYSQDVFHLTQILYKL